MTPADHPDGYRCGGCYPVEFEPAPEREQAYYDVADRLLWGVDLSPQTLARLSLASAVAQKRGDQVAAAGLQAELCLRVEDDVRAFLDDSEGELPDLSDVDTWSWAT